MLIALIGLAYSAINSKPPIQTPHADDTIRLEHETERDNLEFHRKLWLQELDAYRPVAQIAGKIAAHNKDDTHTLNNLIADFNAAYWSALIFGWDKTVEQAMVNFSLQTRDFREGWTTEVRLKNSADELIRTYREAAENPPEN